MRTRAAAVWLVTSVLVGGRAAGLERDPTYESLRSARLENAAVAVTKLGSLIRQSQAPNVIDRVCSRGEPERVADCAQ